MLIKLILSSAIIVTSVAVGYLYHRNDSLRKKYDNITEYFGDMNFVVNAIRYGNLSVRAGESSQKDLKKFTENINRMIETLNDREKMIAEYRIELTKKNNFLATILDSLSDGMLVCDDKFNIIDANEIIKKWLSTEKIVRQKAENFIKVMNEKDLSELKNDEVFLKDNKDMFFKATTTILDSKEHKAKYLITVTNYTNEKEIESLKEDFVATLTHDLKVPIIAEANMLEFFLQGKFGELSDVQLEALNNMNNSNKELLELVQTVLDTYKVKEGEIDLNLETVSVKELLNDIKEDMHSIADKNNNSIVIDIKEEFNLNIDYLQLKRVLKNLINNAIIYGKAGTNIEITVKQKNEKKYICIKDYGKGIAKQDIDKVFNKYYSAHKKFRKIGTGLGLYLSRKLVNAHNGTLEVTSKEGEWTEFVICLPH